MEGVVLRFQAPPQWTLRYAANLALEQHWRGRRKEANCKSWCRMLIEAHPGRTLATLTTYDISAYIRTMQAQGLLPWTVHARVCVIHTIYDVAKRNHYDGPVPTIPYPHVPKQLKWWLTPDMQRELLPWLKDQGELELRHYVLWTVDTGLRVEESLQVNSQHFHGLLSGTPSLLVPGTKTDDAHAALALSAGAAFLAYIRLSAPGRKTASSSRPTTLFTMSYTQLARAWDRARRHFGWPERTATLKALRRSAARKLFVKGAPTPVVQQMLRHADHNTTLGYLKLVGGAFTTEEQRKWL